MKPSCSKLLLITSMMVFGTIGVVRRYLDVPSGLLAMLRGVIGALVLLPFLLRAGKGGSFASVKKHLWLLILVGVLIGFNWIFLFESYRYTTVAVATLCYYMAPVFVMLVSPLFLGERLTRRKIVSLSLSLIGIVFVSGIFSSEPIGRSGGLGILYGLLAAVLYASVIILNKTVKDVGAFERTTVELFAAGVLLLPYSLLFEDVGSIVLSPRAIVLILVVGVIHTGLSYAAYFGSLSQLDAATVSVLSYIDPAVAIVLSVAFLGEPFTPAILIGTVLILGGTLLSELPIKIPHLKDMQE